MEKTFKQKFDEMVTKFAQQCSRPTQNEFLAILSESDYKSAVVEYCGRSPIFLGIERGNVEGIEIANNYVHLIKAPGLASFIVKGDPFVELNPEEDETV